MTYYYYYNFFLQPNDITFSCSNTITPHPLQLRMLLSNTHHYHTRLISYLYFVLIRTKTTLHHTTIIHFLPSLYAHLHLLRTFSIHFFYTTFSLLSTTFPSFNSFSHLFFRHPFFMHSSHYFSEHVPYLSSFHFFGFLVLARDNQLLRQEQYYYFND